MAKKKAKRTPLPTHTEGDWHWELHHLGDYRITDDIGRVVAETRPPGNVSSTGNERENARLIAAAPDLLAALKRLLEESPFMSDCDSCECGENGSGFDDAGNPCEHIQAKRAIVKATGHE